MNDLVRPSTSKEASETKLLCVGCGKYLVPPVIRCESGHETCYICRHRAGRFCSCGSEFEDWARYEKASVDMKFSCSNRVRGCKQKLTIDVLEEHEATCPYNPHSPVAYCQII